MTNEQIIKTGKSLGFKFNEKTNFKDLIANNKIVFDGFNNQRVLVDGKWTDDKILKEFVKEKIKNDKNNR